LGLKFALEAIGGEAKGAFFSHKVDCRVRRFFKDSIFIRGKGETYKRSVGK